MLILKCPFLAVIRFSSLPSLFSDLHTELTYFFSFFSFMVSVYATSARYTILVQETLKGKTATFNHTQAVIYGYGDIMPLFSSVAYKPTSIPKPATVAPPPLHQHPTI
jgi:hypothetical protein